MIRLSIDLSEPLEKKLKARAEAQGRDIASVALELVEKGLDAAPPTPSAWDLTPEQRLKNFREHMEEVKKRPKIDVVLDVSRESIYEGCGE